MSTRSKETIDFDEQRNQSFKKKVFVCDKTTPFSEDGTGSACQGVYEKRSRREEEKKRRGTEEKKSKREVTKRRRGEEQKKIRQETKRRRRDKWKQRRARFKHRESEFFSVVFGGACGATQPRVKLKNT